MAQYFIIRHIAWNFALIILQKNNFGVWYAKCTVDFFLFLRPVCVGFKSMLLLLVHSIRIYIYLSIIMDTGFEFKFLSCIHTISEKARDTHQIMNIYVNIVQHYARSAQLEKYAALYPSCAMWYISCRLYNRMRTFEEYRLTCVVCSFVMVFWALGVAF